MSGDDLGLAIEFATILQQVNDNFEALHQCWLESGKGGISVVSAAFITNVAVADLLELDRQMRELEEDVDVELLQKRCCVLLGLSATDSTPPAAWHVLLQQLGKTEYVWKHHADRHHTGEMLSIPVALQNPLDFICVSPSEETPDNANFEHALLENIAHLSMSASLPCAIVRNSTPVYADFAYVLSKPKEKPKEMRLTSGLHLLTTSYVSYLHGNKRSTASTQNRLVALRITQEAAKSVGNVLQDKTCFPCRCTQTLAFHLQNLEADLLAYASHRCWNLYFQSPWVAGNHILEVLDICHYYGMNLFHYRHYVGSILHSYNVLRQLAGLEEITLLEQLCSQYQCTFFPGGRPTSNFRACWTRYIGARLKIKKGHSSRNHRDSWCMAVPAHAARKAAGLGVGEEGRRDRDESLLFSIKQQDYRITREQQDLIAETELARRGAMSKEARPHGQHKLLKLLPTIDSYFASSDLVSIPGARLNHFAVFGSCVRIISRLSDATHTGKEEKGINCICFASANLNGGDRILEARKMGKTAGACWKKEEREGVLKTTVDALKEEFAKRDLGSWMWKL